MGDRAKNFALWVVIAFILMTLFSSFNPNNEKNSKIAYSEFVSSVDQGEVESVAVNDRNVVGVLTKGETFSTVLPFRNDGALVDKMLQKGVKVEGVEDERPSFLLSLLMQTIPLLLLFALWLWAMRQMQGGGSGSSRNPMSFGRSRARLMGEKEKPITFNDVAGVEEAKEEVQEFVDFLKDPTKFQKLGGKIPCGALLVGSPGTGKTLLAKAVAGEAGVPFFSISGSDFVEMFVGVGASRVRDMFEQAKKQAPCIIFIDEIDAVGRQRGAGLGGGNDEREQTLNQLLVEMDGFEGKEGIIVMAATNRPDVLDPALLRRGRFDRQVMVPLPDINGRQEVLRVHMEKIVTNSDVDPSSIARGTPGFSGADLANLVNEAALFAARRNKKKVSMHELELAKDKILMGSERHSMVMTDEEKLNTAYHEAGHAIVGLNVPDHDPVYKVSIIPRGRALGVTMYLPERDQYSQSLEKLESRISSLYGGRLAEELIFGVEKVTTGASNDIEVATGLARDMVTKYGLNKNLGPIKYTADQHDVFLGKSVGHDKECSEHTAALIDKEVRKVIEQNYERARKILQDNMDKLHAMAEALMKYETIDATQINAIMDGREVLPPVSKSGRGRKKAAAKPKRKSTGSDGNQAHISQDMISGDESPIA